MIPRLRLSFETFATAVILLPFRVPDVHAKAYQDYVRSRPVTHSPSPFVCVSITSFIFQALSLSHALINLLEHQHIQSIQPHGNHPPGLNESQNESISKNSDRHTPKNAKSQVSPQRQHRLVIQESSIQLYRQKVARTSFLFSNGSLYHKITIHKNTKSIHKRVNTIHISLSLIL